MASLAELPCEHGLAASLMVLNLPRLWCMLEVNASHA